MKHFNNVPHHTELRGVLAIIVATAAALCGMGTAFGQCQYSAEEIVAPPCPFIGPPPLIGTGLNNNGEVVGHFRDCEDTALRHPFYWSEKTGLIALPRPDGATTMRPHDINDNQQIVGEVLFPGVAWKGFVYDMNTEKFLFLESKHGVGTANAAAINNNGIAVGSRTISKSGNTPYNAVIWDTNTGDVTDLGVMQKQDSQARAINEHAMTAGLLGTLQSPLGYQSEHKTILILPPLPNGSTSFVNAMNNAAILAGGGRLDDPNITSQPAAWIDGEWELLGLLPGANAGGATSVNAHNQIGGSCNSPSRAFLWQHGEMHDLNGLVPDFSGLTSTRAINDFGKILVRAGTKAVVLSPIDVPLGDLNYDCKVDSDDLMILLDAWGPHAAPRGTTAEPTHPADLNGDGVVDGADLLILLANWNP